MIFILNIRTNITKFVKHYTEKLQGIYLTVQLIQLQYN